MGCIDDSIDAFNDMISRRSSNWSTDLSRFDFFDGLFKFGQECAGEECAEVAALSPRCRVGGIESRQSAKFST